MAGFIQVPPDSTGKMVDGVALTDAGNTVYRQKLVVTGGSGTAEVVVVTNAAPSGTDMGLVVRQAGNIVVNNISATVVVSGAISLAAGTSNIGTINNISATVAVSGAVSLAAGTNNIGTINNISATVVVSGQVSLGPSTNLIGAVSLAAGTANIGTINNISATVVVSGAVSLAAGTSNIGTINNISATVVVSGAVSLAAGTSNIGTINNISAAVVLAAGSANIGFINGISATVVVSGAVSLAAGANNIGTINNISAAVVLAAGSNNIGTINNISAAVVLAAGTANIGAVSIAAGTALMGAVSLAAGTANIGFINNISAAVAMKGIVAHASSVTVGDAPVQFGMRIALSAPAAGTNLAATFGWADKFGREVVMINHPSLLPSASHGPKCVTCSTSAGIALIAAPGAGLSVYITKIACTNGSGTLTRADVFQVSATASCTAQMYMAANGGGFTMDFNPPVQYLSNSGVTCRVKPSVSQTIFVVHFYVGAK